MLKYLADENISPLTVKTIRQLGYDITSAVEIGLQGAEDEKVVLLAQQENRIIITFDLDFGEIFYFASNIDVGIIVLRINPQTVEHTNKRLTTFLKAKIIENSNLAKALIILEEKRYRYRKR